MAADLLEIEYGRRSIAALTRHINTMPLETEDGVEVGISATAA